VLEGINDIGFSVADPSQEVSVEQLIQGYRQLIARAHATCLKIIGATLTPFEGAFYYTPEGEAKRQTLNAFIRSSGEFDGVIDFDLAVRDPANPTRFLPIYQSGDQFIRAMRGTPGWAMRSTSRFSGSHMTRAATENIAATTRI